MIFYSKELKKDELYKLLFDLHYNRFLTIYSIVQLSFNRKSIRYNNINSLKNE